MPRTEIRPEGLGAHLAHRRRQCGPEVLQDRSDETSSTRLARFARRKSLTHGDGNSHSSVASRCRITGSLCVESTLAVEPFPPKMRAPEASRRVR
jgi:hypothetical protein